MITLRIKKDDINLELEGSTKETLEDITMILEHDIFTPRVQEIILRRIVSGFDPVPPGIDGEIWNSINELGDAMIHRMYKGRFPTKKVRKEKEGTRVMFQRVAYNILKEKGKI